MDSLYTFQHEGAVWLRQHPRSGLFDEQGLGKTVQALKAAFRRGGRVLLVVPTVVSHNWAREIRRWVDSSADVQVVSHGKEKIGSDRDWVIVPHSLMLRPAIADQLQGFETTVIDEGHFFRNPTAQRTRQFFLGRDPVCRRAPNCWILTGTPMPNHAGELWPMLAGIAPDRLRQDGKLLNYGAFLDRFCVLAPNPFGTKPKIVGLKNPDELRERLKGFYLRRLKKDVLTLPPIRYGQVVLTPEEAQGEAMQTLEAKFGGLQGEELLDAMRRDTDFSTWRHECGRLKARPAVDLLRSDFESGMGKVVVFAHHLDVIATLVEGLSDYGAVALIGEKSAGERQAAVDAFQNDPKTQVCVAQIAAGGVGVTLTAASDVVMVEQSFVPADNSQCIDRCHRIGQSKSILVRFLSLAGSVDEAVAEILTRKSAMIAEVLK